jgi:hypothetical protein
MRRLAMPDRSSRLSGLVGNNRGFIGAMNRWGFIVILQGLDAK